MSAPRLVYVMVSDLFFLTRIQTAAAHVGTEVVAIAPARLGAACHARRPALVIADLHTGQAPLDAIRDLKRDAAIAAVRVVGFYSHVDHATRRAALDAGVDEAMPRSVFTAKLAQILTG